PPSKRRKTGASTLAAVEHALSQTYEDDDAISVSSDGFSSAPGSPDDSEYNMREVAQTRCLWRDCDFMGGSNNDDLVNHVQRAHCATGGPKKAKYTCEWGECQRKAMTHPSGYALKAHMRSHTKEKPYYCLLPAECDKAFTRSDALSKHMRTVHEPDLSKNAAAPEPTPTSRKSIKLKLANGNKAAAKPVEPPVIISTEELQSSDPRDQNNNIRYVPAFHPVTGQAGFMIHYPADIVFSSRESDMAANDLMRLLRRQLHWAQMEADELKQELEELERIKREEWTLKEVLLEGLMDSE
ncbi:uncharacterized protein K489DRAFT_294274, partial [Dissoconium aciculare CBS 342.82]|uniref:C2H2-type domain-containing protein n=1 Tax=Dissoconium aciculare CBS 342.82 TaxID=1314786 RepID=A0A6J3MDJ4_9PEZI